MIFTDIDKFFKYLTNISREKEYIKIATYNLWTGVDSNGKIYDFNSTYQFLNSIRNKNVKVLLGIPKQMCFCKGCNDNYKKLINRYRHTVREFKEFKWRFSNNSHLKMYRIGSRTFVGGFNLSTSNMDDMMAEAKPTKDYLNIFNKYWSIHISASLLQFVFSPKFKIINSRLVKITYIGATYV